MQVTGANSMDEVYSTACLNVIHGSTGAHLRHTEPVFSLLLHPYEEALRPYKGVSQACPLHNF